MIDEDDLMRLMGEVTENLIRQDDVLPWMEKNNINHEGFMCFIDKGAGSLAMGVASGELNPETALHVLATALFIVGWEAGEQFKGVSDAPDGDLGGAGRG